jgi:hypothetical protein
MLASAKEGACAKALSLWTILREQRNRRLTMTKHVFSAQFCSVRLGNLLFSIYLAFCTLGLGPSASAQQLRITTFNVPAAGKGAGQGTTPLGINDFGVITGIYVNSKNVPYHGFVGTPGAFTGARL